MNADRPGRWYLAAFFLAVSAHAALLTALPPGPVPARTRPVEVELVAASSLVAMAPASELPPSEESESPPEPEIPPPAPEPPAPEPEPVPAPPVPEPVVSPAVRVPKAAPQQRPTVTKSQSSPPKTAAVPVPGAKTGGAASSGPSGVVREARPDAPRNRPPQYPEMARRNGWHGRVIVRASVAASGRVTAVSIRRGSGYGVLDRAALAAVKSWRFVPGSIGGQAADTVVEVPVNFSLRR